MVSPTLFQDQSCFTLVKSIVVVKILHVFFFFAIKNSFPKYQSQALIIMDVQESKPSPNVTVNTLKFPTLLKLPIENDLK